MSSVSVNHPGGRDRRRGKFEKMVVWLIRLLVPPARDNQRAADFLWRRIGTVHPFVQWVAVRSLFAPASTNMANVAHFLCELVANTEAWNEWKGKLPIIVNTAA